MSAEGRSGGSSARQWAALSLAADEVMAEELTEECGLTESELSILGALVHGTPRRYLAEFLGINENTLKSRTRTLLGKAGEETLAPLVWSVHERARKKIGA